MIPYSVGLVFISIIALTVVFAVLFLGFKRPVSCVSLPVLLSLVFPPYVITFPTLIVFTCVLLFFRCLSRVHLFAVSVPVLPVVYLDLIMFFRFFVFDCFGACFFFWIYELY